MPRPYAALGVVVDQQLRVVAVVAGSAAEQAGLQPGDIITRVNDTAVSSAAAGKQLIRQAHAGQQIMLTVERNGQMLVLPVQPAGAARPARAGDTRRLSQAASITSSRILSARAGERSAGDGVLPDGTFQRDLRPSDPRPRQAPMPISPMIRTTKTTQVMATKIQSRWARKRKVVIATRIVGVRISTSTPS